MGNLRSVQKAVEFLGYDCRVQQDLSGATSVILPGVGAFAEAMRRIAPVRSQLDEFVNEAKGYLLGICLGYQLLFEEGDEHGTTRGLGYLDGRVEYLPKDKGLKVPHVGWSPVSFKRPSLAAKVTGLTGSMPPGHYSTSRHWLFEGVEEGSQFYFCHSLYTRTSDLPTCITATAEYGIRFAAAAEQDYIMGVQFHPEKSGAAGLRLLKNFCEAVS
jgi:glutamine amidotransferase